MRHSRACGGPRATTLGPHTHLRTIGACTQRIPQATACVRRSLPAIDVALRESPHTRSRRGVAQTVDPPATQRRRAPPPHVPDTVDRCPRARSPKHLGQDYPCFTVSVLTGQLRDKTAERHPPHHHKSLSLVQLLGTFELFHWGKAWEFLCFGKQQGIP